MTLRHPVDFVILETLENTGRNVAINIYLDTKEKYEKIGHEEEDISKRLPVLEDYGLVKEIGPVNQSGLYEITSLGKAALVYQDQYNEVDDFQSLIQGPKTGANSSPEPQASFVRRGTTDEDEQNDE